MTVADDYEQALRNQQLIVAAMPRSLVAREDRFVEQLRKAAVSPLRKLEMLYELMDKLGGVMQKYTPCRKGCSACCHYPVSVSEIEVQYIEKHAKRRRNRYQVGHTDFWGRPCPFLSGGMCSIYNARPFVCRRHHALTPTAYWCQTERSKEQVFPLIRFTGIEGAFESIRRESGPLEFNDIRQVFGSTPND